MATEHLWWGRGEFWENLRSSDRGEVRSFSAVDHAQELEETPDQGPEGSLEKDWSKHGVQSLDSGLGLAGYAKWESETNSRCV